ncbi:MAG: hypothetical protein ABIP75_17980 [Pyrinomonadaceae bacterium]
MNKYRRIEINAYRRQMTIVSGEWPREGFPQQRSSTDDCVSLNDTDSIVPVAPDSPEGQLLLVEAMRSLERRLVPEIRTAITAEQRPTGPNDAITFYGRLQSLYQLIWPKVTYPAQKEK